MRVATWNVNGIRARFAEVTAWADRTLPHVFCLQEIKASPAQIPEPLTGLPGYFNHWHGAATGYSGVSLHVRRGAFTETPQFEHPSFDEENRIAVVRLGHLVVASIYVHNGAKGLEPKLRFLEALASWVAERHAAGDRLLLCGDLNVARNDLDLHERHRKRGAVGQSKGERERLERVIDQGLVDVLRHFHPHDDTLFTWWPPWREEKQKNRGWRIDYVLASRAFQLNGCDILRDEGSSDHVPFVVDLE
jgi:exodeoxyribonuclease III